MNRNLLLVTVLTLVLASSGYAQTDSTKKSTTVVIFGDVPMEAPKYNAQAVKLGIFDMISGVYGLFYEKELSSIFAIQAGAGLTGRNYMQGIGADDWETEDDGSFHYNYDHRTVKTGYFLSLQPKIYYDEYGYDGPYFAFNLAYRHHAFDAQRVDWVATNENTTIPTFKVGNEYKETENQTILALFFGYQWVNTKTVLDSNFGVGFRNISGKRRFVDEYSYEGIPRTDYLAPTKRKQIYVEWGFKLGLQWAKK